MRTRALPSLVVVFLLCTLRAPAHGQHPSRPSAASALSHGARALIERGVQALAAKDLQTAARLLTDAYRQSLRSEVLYQLGRLAAAEGRTLDAYDLMRRYLADPTREMDEAATRAAEEIVNQPPPPSGSLSVLSDPGALVLVDQHAVATLPLLSPLMVSPGAHTVNLEFPSKTMEAPVQVELGRLTEVRMSRTSGAVLVSVLPAILFWPTGSELPALNEAVEQAAHDEQYTLLRADTLLAKGQEYKSCLARPSCQLELATKNKVDFVLQQDMQVQGAVPSQAYKLRLKLLRVDISEPAATAEPSCAACTIAQATTTLKEAAAKLLATGLARPRGTLSVTTEPAAARLQVGNNPPAPGPYSAAVWAGTYEVTATHPGYRTEQSTIEVLDGKRAEVHLQLQQQLVAQVPIAQLTTQKPTRAPRPRWRLGVGAALVGVGLALVVSGAYGLSKNQTCVVPPADPLDTCKDIYDTGVAGGVTLGSGIAVMGAGAVLMALPGPLR